jgi:hypothetical protein
MVAVRAGYSLQSLYSLGWCEKVALGAPHGCSLGSYSCQSLCSPVCPLASSWAVASLSTVMAGTSVGVGVSPVHVLLRQDEPSGEPALRGRKRCFIVPLIPVEVMPTQLSVADWECMSEVGMCARTWWFLVLPNTKCRSLLHHLET